MFLEKILDSFLQEIVDGAIEVDGEFLEFFEKGSIQGRGEFGFLLHQLSYICV